MPVVRLRHVHKGRHRDGRPRWLLRVPGCRAVTLPGEPGTPAFMAAYQRALETAAPPERTTPGSLDALALSYYASPAFTALRPSTRAAYKRLVEELRAGYGTRPIRLLEPRHIEAMMAQKAEAPTAANHRLRTLRHLMAHAIRLGWIRRDPTQGVARVPYRTDGYHTWTEAEIEAFEAHHPSGSRERLAFALLLYTGQRRSDVVRMGWRHHREVTVNGRAVRVIEVTQVKTGRRLAIPVHEALAAELDQAPRDLLPFLRTAYGKPFSPRGFYNQFCGWAEAAGLPPGRSPHGLRKAAGRRLAEAGATAHQIMSILGVTLQTATIYTREAEQMRMAVAGMERIGG
ncbi:phage integrase family protein [Roseomonas alkaliterrae]|uniref:tyrosine-type recombinase/integrase n=1 Tax=Neoroseomonas alkaliterrae TaxID=1452450 RepID=UPI001BA43D07|nr:tyrosine-type recombinase/integrase [Neoroseomonas alkaliterrae]MBR0676657.1 phage integrase family protein [Neoroseomonas alkaliterrae]